MWSIKMRNFASLFFLISLHCYLNEAAIDFKAKALDLENFPIIDEQVWWIERVTKFDSAGFSQEDEKFCSPRTFFKHCGPIRVKWDIIDDVPTRREWAFNTRDNKIYYFESEVMKSDEKKGIFQLDVKKEGKVAGADNKVQSIKITEKAEAAQEKFYAVVYGKPEGKFQIIADENNVWIKIRDYVVKQGKVQELYQNEIKNVLNSLNLGIPDERFIDISERFPFKVDYLKFEGHNCKVPAVEMDKYLQSITVGWIDRVSKYSFTPYTPKEAFTQDDIQFCSPMTFFDKCGPIRMVKDEKMASDRVWAYRSDNGGKGKINVFEMRVEKLDEKLAIFRSRINASGKVLEEGKAAAPIEMTDMVLELQEEPYALMYVDPNGKYEIYADCDSRNAWVLVSESAVQNNEVKSLEPAIKEMMRNLEQSGKEYADLSEAFPILVEL